jgi:Ca-activated chloride channel family protein
MTAAHLRRGLPPLFLLFLASLHAQTPLFRSATRLVVLHATVTDRHGDLVTNLDAGAFSIFENGIRQPIALFRRDDVPVSIGLLVDNSGSMRSLRAKVEAAALAFARASNPQDEMFVLNFADKARLDVPMTSDLGALERGIARVDSIGGTAMRDAIETAENYLRDHAKQDRRVLLVITDGIDNASTATGADIERHAERTETVIDAVGLFHTQDGSRGSEGRRQLKELTERTGGIAYFPEGVDQVESVTVGLARQIRSQYTIAYMPTRQALDGSYRSIRVTASGPERYTVRTRAGYRAVPDAQRKESTSF